MSEFPIKKLRDWFLAAKRDLPWRENPSPYSVWVSEMMLQQTQVDVVIPYFLRWMQRFPTIRDLASASSDEVIKVWEGLGYYSRARYLHQGAIYVCEHFNGELPNNIDDLRKIKGLGPYTLGAILSFAFHQKVGAVDGNVIRVLSRYYDLHEDVSKPKTVQKLRLFAEDLLPDFEPWVINEALIELGAIICSKKPQCQKCPLKANCSGFLKGTAAQLPFKSIKTKTEHLHRAVAVIFHKQHVLLKRGKAGEIMCDLHEFPYFETSIEGMTQDELILKVYEDLNIQAVPQRTLPMVSHSFTRFQVKLNSTVFESVSKMDVEGFFWHPVNEIDQLAFSSGHKRVLQLLSGI